MSNETDDILKVGDMAEFDTQSFPIEQSKWTAQRVTEICILEEYDDKEGVSVPQLSWHDIREYKYLAIIAGTDNWARNDQVRPVSKSAQTSSVKG